MNQSGAGFKLGLFVVSGIALTLVAVFALGAGAFLEKRQPLYCYFTESVKGLERDSAVTYRGVRIGRVVRVVPQIGTESRGSAVKGDIRVECEVDPRLMGIEDLGVFTQGDTVTEFVEKQVRRGLRVQLSLGDLIGSKYLELDYMADEVFFVGTAVEVTPIRSVDRVTVGRGRRGPLTEAIQQRFFQIVRGEAPDTHGWLQPVQSRETATTAPPKSR
jgi:hypothetical protein